MSNHPAVPLPGEDPEDAGNGPPPCEPAWFELPAAGRAAIPELWQRAGGLVDGQPAVSLVSVWLRYFSFGGRAGLIEMWAYLCGALACPPGEAVRLEHAVWELEAFGED